MGGGVSLIALGRIEISDSLAFEVSEMMNKMSVDEIATEFSRVYDLNPKQFEDVVAECRRRSFVRLNQDAGGE